MEFETDKINNPGGRTSNQDYADFIVLERERVACWVVADGLGGHMGGETASKTAVEVILNSFKQNPECTAEAVKRYMQTAQNELVRIQGQNPRLSQMRTTLVMLVTDFEHMVWGHIGDSRLYQLEDGIIRFQTKDHSVPQSMVAAGDIKADQIRHHEDRNRLLRSMGQPESFRPEILEFRKKLYDGDAFLLCTDGFWEYVEEPEMELDFAKAKEPKEWLQKMESRILNKAEGEFDNYTAVAVYFHSPSRPRPPHTEIISQKVTAKETVKPTLNFKRIAISLMIVAELILLAFLLFKVKPPQSLKPPPSIKSPTDLIHSKRIYRPAQKALYLSLAEAMAAANEGEEIWIGPGYFYFELESRRNGVNLKGAGLNETYVFTKLKMRSDFVHLFIPVIEAIQNINQINGIIKDGSIIDLDNKMKIAKIWPHEDSNNKKKIQKLLNHFLSYFEWTKMSIGEVMGPGVTAKQNNGRREK